MRTDRHWLHQKIVAYAREHGIKATVREFGCSRNTVRKWLRRAIPGKPSSLAEHSRAPKHKLRKQPGFGAEHLVREFDLKVSRNAVEGSALLAAQVAAVTADASGNVSGLRLGRDPMP